MSVQIINTYIEEKDGPFYQLHIGRWHSMWTYSSGLDALEALKAEVETDGEKARLVDSLGEVQP